MPTLTEGEYSKPAGFETYVSGTKGYSVVYPEDWTVAADFAKIGSAQTDQFIAPAEDGTSTNVGVSNCEDPGDLSSEEFLRASLAPFGEGAKDVSEPEEIVTRSGTGELVDFEFVFGSTTLDYMFFALVDGDCARVVALATVEGKRGAYDRIFRTMLESLENTDGTGQEL